MVKRNVENKKTRLLAGFFVDNEGAKVREYTPPGGR